MSAHLQVLGQLTDKFEIVAFLDADSIARPDWLRSMIGPFRDPKVGATSGVRWYTPRDKSFGSLVRHLFNIGALGTMYVFHISWGGSQAIRFSIVRGANLVSFWSRCFGEDTSIHRVLRPLGLRLEFVPVATNFNWESSTLDGAMRFIQRQTISARLHSNYWPVILVSGVANVSAIVICYLLLAIGVATRTWQLTFGPAILLIGLGLGTYTLLMIGERLVRQRKNPPPPAHFGWKVVPASVVMYAMSACALIRAMTIRTFDWRGINYRIGGRDRLYMLGYSPYCPPRLDATGTDSIL
jgi:hypothetical protein